MVAGLLLVGYGSAEVPTPIPPSPTAPPPTEAAPAARVGRKVDKICLGTGPTCMESGFKGMQSVAEGYNNRGLFCQEMAR
jgi:hypothetical protein